ncbi:hypothetical protein LOTGIDRAFT_236224 [Lottia gigantea]|uniref:Letm1 RBD domain-containing protein n=1 Tax=Lottia gigantea TaxID=225164 RepID=V4B7I5_LOTGI|nr:hypothetical protein LOTGIDRAFT_236224 [Lottia gigantea]ESO84564.1 hypothetical protein LOTGIDRAFT_236224 [Lottia gigantea]
MAAPSIRYFCCCTNSSKVYFFPKNTTVCRYYSNKIEKPKDVIQPPGKVTRYFVDKIKSLIQSSEKTASNKFPKAFNVYHTLKTGTSDFFSDTKVYFRVLFELWGGKKVGQFSHSELVIYSQLRKDIWRLTPLLIFTGLIPMGASILPIAYMFPRYLLSHHFWTRKQKEEFYNQDLKKQLAHCPDILKFFNSYSKHIEDKNLQERVRHMVQEIKMKQFQNGEKILEIQPLFNGKPYNLDKLSLAYTRHLAKCLDLSVRSSKLKHDSLIFLNIDRAMRREGLLTLKDEEIERACYARGVNPMGLNREEKLKYLRQWVDVSHKIDESSVSLLLHLPIFLAYTHPANRKLLKHKS